MDAETERFTPFWYCAPSNMTGFCEECGETIVPGELIGEPQEFEFFHEICWQAKIEEMQEDGRE